MMSDEDEDNSGIYAESELECGDDDPAELRGSSHRVITAESLALAQQQDLQRVMDMFGVKIQHARALLIHYRWNVEVLFSYMAEAGRDAVFRRVGLPALAENQPASQPLPSTVTCGICFDDVPQADATQMDCGHAFCNDCWLENFTVKIMEGESRKLKCMAFKCATICDEEKVRAVLAFRNSEALARYERCLLESYIEDNAAVKWCPSVPHCGNAIKVEGGPYWEIECLCSHQFCFNCLKLPHSPLSCSLWELWERKCKDDSETNHWITSHTKSCPKCSKPVEKNEGCNLMTCRCGQHFCWKCGTATGAAHSYEHIVGHSCGRYKEEAETRAADAKRTLSRYLHYYKLWRAHMDSLKFEEKQEQLVQEKIERLEQRDLIVKDYTWLKSGLQMLYKARRAVSCSYPFAFFMFGNDLFKDDISPEQNAMNQVLFEDQQQQFEEQVERLSMLIEMPEEVLEQDISGVRFKVLSVTALTDRLCCRLYELIEDLLGSVISATHHIAPYSSQVERVSAEPAMNTSNPSDQKCKRSIDDTDLDANKRPHTHKSSSSDVY
ncbi:probable E3 ubiquitin-protein ligase ARI1 [Selaginella moellendorffii]|uniref:probable E3 ubiquitin-protein ligase ARI1 n=1 Tax=Selaginella moellendorffii TaxID=88036 RepID=UPI000D1C97BC|nr:probable E3 ubiquitin-protein ligase ARI1 [Selaginella moellendorffii]|eukprot:XP_024515823.1 probable E3 ubiquitin-protein ligase ARI1 [Selaginella moellendorffii]